MKKNNSLNGNSSFLDNSLIEDNYDHLVLDKITKELLNNNHPKCCDSCEENKPENKSSEFNDRKNIFVVKCKGLLGIQFCENKNKFTINLNDNIIIQINGEFEFATVIETGEMVNIRHDKLNSESDVLPVIERIANEKDIEKNLSNIVNSNNAKATFHELVNRLSLGMKLVDIHYQFDRKKLFFFYTANGRVDFRELAKKLAAIFRTRIELRQIGVRDEAKRIGGLATCGREYCCVSFISNFKRITTDIAIENNITTSISKYTGPCGKLKCCLSFEV